MASIRSMILPVSDLLGPSVAKAMVLLSEIKDFMIGFVETMVKVFDDIAFGETVTMAVSEHILHLEPALGKELANESSSEFILVFDSSFIEFVKPSFCFSRKGKGKHHYADNFFFGISIFEHITNSKKFMNVFVRIGFDSTIKLVSLDESQVITFNGKFICDFRNGDCRTGSRSDNTVGNPHGFIIHWIIFVEDIEKVTKVVDVNDWSVDDSGLLRWFVSSFEWNSSVST
nr:hypothetical protein [Tanacetum cinerariifolium]